MAQALWWWLVVQVVALCALPLSLTLFAPLADRGYGLAKAFGLLLFAYLVWLLASTPLLPNVPLVLGLALLLIGSGSALVLRRGEGRRAGRLAELLTFWRRRRGLLLLEEALFLGAFLGFLALRAYSPEIAGTEKFMDFAFLNAITRSAHFPPLDPWLAPSPAFPAPTINYYYFGYLIQALLLELANIIPGAVHPAVGFNLALGLLFALTALGAFSLGYGLARDLVAEGTVARSRPATVTPSSLPSGAAPAGAGSAGAAAPASRGPARSPTWSLRAAWPYVATGLLTAFLLLVAGNLWTALRLVDGSGMWSRDFWQGIGWNATRVLVIKDGEQDLDYTINEFPAFSFILGDLHPHVLALPFAVLAVGLAYRWLLAPPRLYRWALEVPGPQSRAPSPGSGARRVRPVLDALAELLPGALILGSLYFLNSWDFPAYFLLAQAGAIGGAWWQARHTSVRGIPEGRPEASDGGRGPWDVGLRTTLVVVLVGALSLALVAPFLLTFRPPVVAEAGGLPLDVVLQRSRLGQFFQFWGGQLLLLIPVLLTAVLALGLPPLLSQLLGGWGGRPAQSTGIVARAAPDHSRDFWSAPAWEAALLLGGGLVLVLLAERFQAGALALSLLLAGGSAWVAWRALTGEAGGMGGMGRPLAFAAAAVALGALLLAGCEVVYIRDFYGGALRRMNTVFKFYYQAWLLFAVGGGLSAFWLLRRLRFSRVALVGLAVLLGALALFPAKAALLRTDGFRNAPTLNGMAWLQRAHPEDYAAAEWLRLNGAAGSGQRAPVVLEASGGAYSEFARISTQTGFPTVLGWDQHERLWRGARIEPEITARQRDIDAIYSAATLEEARPLLDKYGIAYVVIGYLERQKYGASRGLAKFEAAGPAVVFRQGQTLIYGTPPAP